MRLLLDTHRLLWTVRQPDSVTRAARRMIADPANNLHLSVVSLWEVAIRQSSSRADLTVDSGMLPRSPLGSSHDEVAVDRIHAVAVDSLPLLHKDPLDRLLVAQTMVEGIVLPASEARLARYPGPIRKV